MRILLVEDDRLLGDGVETALLREGVTVDWLQNGLSALHALQSEHFDLVLLDLGLPGMDGLEVLRHIREAGVATPVLILTARDAVDERVKGLDLGADDYLVKPFDFDELKARVRALRRRAIGRPEPRLVHGELELDPSSFAVSLRGESVILYRREYMLLKALLERVGRVVSREQLEQSLYGWADDVDSNTVDVYIHHLRKKLYPELIRTVRGIGYIIDRPE